MFTSSLSFQITKKNINVHIQHGELYFHDIKHRTDYFSGFVTYLANFGTFMYVIEYWSNITGKSMAEKNFLAFFSSFIHIPKG